MSNHSDVPAFSGSGRFCFTIRADADNVSFSRTVGPEDRDAVRRQIAEWESRRSPQNLE